MAEIKTSSNPLAYNIVSALQDGRLMADPDTKKIYVTQPDGKIIDALTGAPVASIPDSAALFGSASGSASGSGFDNRETP